MPKQRKSLKSPRAKAFQRQDGRCFYCALPMWVDGPEAFAARYKLTIGQTKNLKCTGEHLQAKCDGGKDFGTNIVAACWLCNIRRHRRKKVMTPDKYGSFVKKRIRNGRWISRDIALLSPQNCE